MRTLARRYVREFGGAMLAYTLLMMLAVRALRHAEATWLRAALALLPVIGTQAMLLVLPACALAYGGFAAVASHRYR